MKPVIGQWVKVPWRKYHPFWMKKYQGRAGVITEIPKDDAQSVSIQFGKETVHYVKVRYLALHEPTEEEFAEWATMIMKK